MKITHHYTKQPVSKMVNASQAFLMVNNKKDFISFYPETSSRYEGFFMRTAKGYIKILAGIEISGNLKPLEMSVNHLFSTVGRKYHNFSESFSLDKESSVVIWEATEKQKIKLFLDTRGIFDSPDFGRNFEITEKEGMTLVKYTDNTAEPIFVAIIAGNLKLLKEWSKKVYARDAQRNSAPYSLYEFLLGEAETEKVIISAALTESEAINKANEFLTVSKIGFVKKDKENKRQTKLTDKSALETARYCARRNLEDLLRPDGLMAGFPWFVHPWSRDELLSLPALEEAKAKKILKRYLRADWPGGKIPVIIGSAHCSSDALGTLCWAILHAEFKLSLDDKIHLAGKILKALEELEKQENSLGFIYSGYNESWMDTIGREGYPIEIQTLYSKILELAYFLTGDVKYDKKRSQLLKNIRLYFLNEKVGITDILSDDTARPNIFLAAFFAPEILTNKEWEKCFDKVLPKLWLSWGGLASVEKGSPFYKDISSGESNQSYHNGDSWFMVNNIAALVLWNVNHRKYGRFIGKILEASTEEILYHNLIGHAGEISSAKSLDSWGCGSQAFSASTYLYLVRNMDIRKKGFIRERVKNIAGKSYVF
ncbi:MAG: hypothetical protein UT66_C0001G0005 [candidate division CPR2 bacterium GW2011_GWC1_39_9]|nr:MAG: hypothetical protein UT66_C0001G0005 [candidate division CPR2 bacterium GW2011_GWC1_39_9]